MAEQTQLGGIRVTRCESALEVGEHCARRIRAVLAEVRAQRTSSAASTDGAHRPAPVLGLATGSSPLPTYAAILRLFEEDPEFDLSDVITFNLDEYLDLPPEHPESYHSFMFTNLFTEKLLHSESNPRGIRRENIHIPRGMAQQLAQLNDEELEILNDLRSKSGSALDSAKLTDIEEKRILAHRTEEYESLIKNLGPVDLQVLGIGHNGHIGFAEPGSDFAGPTKLVTLTAETREANSRFFDGDVSKTPQYAITMGIGTILRAKRVLLIATGSGKQAIVQKTLSSKPDPQIPASALHLHTDVEFVVDREAVPFAKE